jgi:3-oxoacyl-[acyl-carrier-protein] synthase-3
MSKIQAAITGITGYVPEYKLTNERLTKLVDTSDDWITSRTGIKERRILKGKDKGVSYMGAQAVKQLPEETNTDPSEVDLLICATVTPDMQFPASANVICDEMNIRNAMSFDLAAACSGFIYALTTASQFIETGKYKKVVVVGGDKMSSIINYADRTTCVIFGDGAGVLMLEPNEEGLGVQDFILRSDGAGRNYLLQPGGGSLNPASAETVEKKMHFVKQEGKQVFKFAVTNMAEVSAEIMEKNNLTSDDVDWLVPHQANLRIIDATANRINLDPKKVLMNIEKYGNTTSGTLPLLLSDYESKLKKGDNLIFAAFGGGFNWGSVYLKWAYNS